jgi:NADH:ubiquinone oxidoreductase subunit 6 (subunit J)
LIYAALFYLIAGFTILSALGVALSQNVVYAAFALMGTLIGAAGLYAFLAADFVAVVQVLVYVGGILVLTLFAIMLTHQISDINVSNRSVGWAPAALLVLAAGGAMSYAVISGDWFTAPLVEATPTTFSVGEAFLGKYLLPFELASLVLLTALIGSIVLSRKELRD